MKDLQALTCGAQWIGYRHLRGADYVEKNGHSKKLLLGKFFFSRRYDAQRSCFSVTVRDPSHIGQPRKGTNVYQCFHECFFGVSGIPKRGTRFKIVPQRVIHTYSVALLRVALRATRFIHPKKSRSIRQPGKHSVQKQHDDSKWLHSKKGCQLRFAITISLTSTLKDHDQ